LSIALVWSDCDTKKANSIQLQYQICRATFNLFPRSIEQKTSECNFKFARRDCDFERAFTFVDSHMDWSMVCDCLKLDAHYDAANLNDEEKAGKKFKATSQNGCGCTAGRKAHAHAAGAYGLHKLYRMVTGWANAGGAVGRQDNPSLGC
jgi:hypothetical protein